jgi:hypothetical protein
VPFIDPTGATVLRDAQMSASRSQVTMIIVGLPVHMASTLTGTESPTTVPAHR